jgi:Mn-dependent DtxR family transcriptional regulator
LLRDRNKCPHHKQLYVMVSNITIEMPGANRDEDTGEYREKYPDEDFVEFLDEDGPAGTQDIADAVGCSYDHAYKTLRRLADEEERITSSRIGNARLWELGETADEPDGETTDHPDEDIVEFLDEEGPAGTIAVADAVGCSHDHAYKTLRRLHEGNWVTSSQVGGGRFWESNGGKGVAQHFEELQAEDPDTYDEAAKSDALFRIVDKHGDDPKDGHIEHDLTLREVFEELNRMDVDEECGAAEDWPGRKPIWSEGEHWHEAREADEDLEETDREDLEEIRKRVYGDTEDDEEGETVEEEREA